MSGYIHARTGKAADPRAIRGMCVNVMLGGVGGGRLASGEDFGVGRYQWRPRRRAVMSVFGIHADEMVATDPGERVPGGRVHRAALPTLSPQRPGLAPSR